MNSPQNFHPVYLHFSDGTIFKARSNKAITKDIWGEAAFTTSMSGYQETMTDPSYLGQHLIFANPHIGNYPIDERAYQSQKTHTYSVIARHFSQHAYFCDDIPFIDQLDTRALVKHLSQNSSSHNSIMLISSSMDCPSAYEFNADKLHCSRLDLVSQKKEQVLKEGTHPIVLINYGTKNAIIQELLKLNYPLVSVPYDITAAEIKKYDPSLIFLSNGPGDPRNYSQQVLELKKMLSLQVPIRGICLGHQLLSLALGAKVIRLPFGQRGSNHPLFNHETGKVQISSQNHGYATCLQSFKDLDAKYYITHSSLFDQSIEGLASKDGKVRSVQFHPEASPGPKDCLLFFEKIKNYLKKNDPATFSLKTAPDFQRDLLSQKEAKNISYKKILIIGSGPIKIGQASEFDYSGTQACKSLKEVGIKVVLLNSNPATIMTDPQMSDATYVEPITKETIKKIILKESVDAVLSTMGGQTALNICLQLEEENFLKNHNVALLGANIETIKKTEDRDLFAIECQSLGFKAGKRYQGHSAQEVIELAQSTVSYPLIIRRDFALGGKGAALVYNQEELEEVLKSDIKYPVSLEKSLVGQKEVELEVMVDEKQNGLIICSIENIDPCGVHTGDSITVAPAQTISDRCMQKLRTMALDLAVHMGVVAGGANVQFAINEEDEDDITIIEMNPRVSRSSALASKATGYPIAKISALLAIGFTLAEIKNDITKVSPVSFEPSLDYVAIKIPIFPFNKFPSSSRLLGPQMRSVGEVLALGSSFNEAFMKALRSLEIGLEIPLLSQLRTVPTSLDTKQLEMRLRKPQELSLLSVLEALRADINSESIFKWSKISPWFIDQMKILVSAEKLLSDCPETIKDPTQLLYFKQLGFSDKYLALLSQKSQGDIFNLRRVYGISPFYKAVDTCSGEFAAQTPYFYSTYLGVNHDSTPLESDQSTIILGSGPNRIGQGIEFDYSCVKACFHLKDLGHKSILINSNPETVSTDYDSSDKLYLSPLYSEDLFDIFLYENPKNIISCFSGQTGIKVREYIQSGFRSELKEFNFLGPSLESLDICEDRSRFSQLIHNTALAQTKSFEVTGHKKFINALSELGMPVMVRPSYVIGGESMYILYSHKDIDDLPPALLEQLKYSKTTFQVENYLQQALEYDVDLIRDKDGNCVFTLCEHIEHAGVHSGDSAMISPAVSLTSKNFNLLKEISTQLANKLEIVGPINFQYAICKTLEGDAIYCIEANPRGSRTLPFLSKTYHLDLAGLAVDAMLGKSIKNWSQEHSPYFAVKQSTFPFDRFLQDNIILGPKMRSTGETLGIDRDKDIAVVKSLLGNYPKINKVGKIFISLSDRHKHLILPYLKSFQKQGYRFVATSGTSQYIKKQGIECREVLKITDDPSSIINTLKDDDLVMVFNTPENAGRSKSDGEFIRNNAISFGAPCFTRPETIQNVCESLLGSFEQDINPISLQELIETKSRSGV